MISSRFLQVLVYPIHYQLYPPRTQLGTLVQELHDPYQYKDAGLVFTVQAYLVYPVCG